MLFLRSLAIYGLDMADDTLINKYTSICKEIADVKGLFKRSMHEDHPKAVPSHSISGCAASCPIYFPPSLRLHIRDEGFREETARPRISRAIAIAAGLATRRSHPNPSWRCECCWSPSASWPTSSSAASPPGSSRTRARRAERRRASKRDEDCAYRAYSRA